MDINLLKIYFCIHVETYPNGKVSSNLHGTLVLLQIIKLI